MLFDLDNTLVDRAEGFKVWAARFASRRSLLHMPEVAWLELIDDDGLTPRAEFFGLVRQRYGLDDSVDALVSEYRSEYPRCFPPLSEATASALGSLRRDGWKVGIVSNGAPSQETKIRLTGLDELVDGWAISQIVGVRKPDPAIFQAAADACGSSLDGGWMVGDSAEADIMGAAACGLASIWITRGREWRKAAYRPTALAATVADAVAIIVAGG